MNGHRGSVTCLDSFDVNTIVSGSEDKTIRIWDVRTRKCVQGIMSFSHAINSISIIGNTLYASAGNVIRAFDLRKNALVVKECLFESQPQSEEVNKLHSFSSNSLISCNDLGEVIKYSLSLQESEIICKHNELCQAVACNDTFIASGGNDCLVKIMKDERILKEIDTSRFREETAMVFNPPFVTDLLCIQDNLIVGLGNGTLAKYNFNTGNISSVKGHDYSVSKMCPVDSEKFVSVGLDGKVLFWKKMRNPELLSQTRQKYNDVLCMNNQCYLASAGCESIEMISLCWH